MALWYRASMLGMLAQSTGLLAPELPDSAKAWCSTLPPDSRLSSWSLALCTMDFLWTLKNLLDRSKKGCADKDWRSKVEKGNPRGPNCESKPV